MKLAELVLGESCLHSSQIHGFATGKLKEPGPKVLMVVGLVNLAIAAANEDVDARSRSTYSVPATKPDLWHGKAWIKDANGKALGPAEVFLAFCGILDLACDAAMAIKPEDMEAVSKALGKYLRKSLSKLDIDVMDEEVFSSWGRPEIMNKLIYGKVLTQAELEDNLEYLCDIVEQDIDSVIEVVINPVIQ